jgi:uncharacterized protein YciI
MNRYLVLTTRKPTFQESAVAAHYAFLTQLRSQGKLEMAGPFTDKSGGAYVLKVASFAEAKTLAESDPVYTTDSSQVTVYEWNAS